MDDEVPQSKKRKKMVLPEYNEYAERIRKTLYYSQLPTTDRPSFPFTRIVCILYIEDGGGTQIECNLTAADGLILLEELCVEKFSGLCRQDGLDKLDLRYASTVSYDACVTPCSLIVALVYLDRLRTHNPEYLATASPSQVFLVAMLVASKYLYDDGGEDEVFNDEWAASAALPLTQLNRAERDFLIAIDWNLFVDDSIFREVLEKVECDIACREGLLRGQFTYMDLIALGRNISPIWLPLLEQAAQVLSVFVVSYVAAVASLVAGTALAQHCSEQVIQVLGHVMQIYGSESCSQLGTTSAVAEPSCLLSLAPVASSLPAYLTDTDIEDCASLEGNETSVGSASQVLTTLTTSIILALTSPFPATQREVVNSDLAPNSQHNRVDDVENLRDVTESTLVNPANIRLPFTTGPYWMPSHHQPQSSFDADCLFDCRDKFPQFPMPLTSDRPWNPQIMSGAAPHLTNYTGIGAPNALNLGDQSGPPWSKAITAIQNFLHHIAASFFALDHGPPLPKFGLLSPVALAVS
ncbi:uncharacterized protein LOC143033954 isoform X2 [Oratosquilla oratoria]|uniref:uncharacterized protein LOC143033954 isoform X2 n=1 Tax=Oratosquilla oratoria TaxID=337810 RepID=UPI003F76BD54